MTTLLALKNATETTANVWVRRTETGVMTVNCNGQTHTGSTLSPSVDDGCGYCTVTGLVANTSYPFTVSVGGVQVDSGTLKTMPSANSTVTIGFSSCVAQARDAISVSAFMDKFPSANAFVWLGDVPYIDSYSTITGQYRIGSEVMYATGITAALNPDDETAIKATITAHYRGYWGRPILKVSLRKMPHYFVTDDHERPGNDWMHLSDLTTNLTSANAYHPWATTQAHVDNMDKWCLDVAGAYYLGNPENPTGDPLLANNRQLYYDTVIGDVHMICVDCTEYSTVNADFPEFLGVAQYAWLKAKLLASTSTWKVVLGGKSCILPYNTAKVKPFYDWMVANGITGVVWAGGDIHTPAAFKYGNLYSIYASPASADMNYSSGDGYPAGFIWKWVGQIGNAVGTEAQNALNQRNRMVVGYVTAYGKSALEMGIMDDAGDVIWSARINPDGTQAASGLRIS